MKPSEWKVIPYDTKYAEQTVRMWRDSKEKALGQQSARSVEEQTYFLNRILPQRFQVELAFADDRVVGMIAYNAQEISQLYIHMDYQGRGIGETFLRKAQAESSGSLTLYTFEVNVIAQRFYEKHGFKVISRGHENEERLPDIRYEWVRAESSPIGGVK